MQNAEPPILRAWTRVAEPVADLEDRVIENGGALITGPAGTGKTHFVNRLVSRWKEREQVQFILGAPTHMVARLLLGKGGHTLERLRRRYRHRCPQNCDFVIDEISQVPLSMLSVLARFCHFGARFVLVGDFDGQMRGRLLGPQWTRSC